MSSVDQLRKGRVIRNEGHLFSVLEYATAQTGKQKATVHVKLRSLKSRHAVDRTLDQLGRIDEVATEVRAMQYLYAAGRERHFMDAESSEQCALGEDVL